MFRKEGTFLSRLGFGNKDISAELLANNLFFHSLSENYSDYAISQIAKGFPLFSLRGRATIVSGAPLIGDDPVLIYLISSEGQNDFLEPSYIGAYDSWGGINHFMAFKEVCSQKIYRRSS